MSVTAANEIFEGTEGEWKLDRQVQGTVMMMNTRTYARHWKVYTNSAADDAFTVNTYLAGIGVAIGSAHPNDAYAICGSVKSSRPGDNAKFWKSTASYSTVLDPSWFVDNPLDVPVRIKRAGRKEKLAILETTLLDTNWEEVDRALVCNSAGAPFDPGLETDCSITRYTLVKNVGSIDYVLLDSMENKLNKDTYRGCAPGTLRVDNVDASDELFNNAFTYWTLTWNVEYRGVDHPLGPWYNQKILDAGFYQATGGRPAKLTAITVPDGGGKLEITGFDVTDQGAGYSQGALPRVIITDSTGTNAAGYVTMQPDPDNAGRFRVAFATIRNISSGYTAPVVTLSDPPSPILHIRDQLNQPVSTPWPLDGHGRKLPFGGTPVYLGFNPYGEPVNFTGVLP